MGICKYLLDLLLFTGKLFEAGLSGKVCSMYVCIPYNIIIHEQLALTDKRFLKVYILIC